MFESCRAHHVIKEQTLFAPFLYVLEQLFFPYVLCKVADVLATRPKGVHLVG